MGNSPKPSQFGVQALDESAAVQHSSHDQQSREAHIAGHAANNHHCAESIVIQIPSRPEFVRVVRLALLGIASRMDFSFDDVEDIKLAVSEACNNAILHAVSGTEYSGRSQHKEPDKPQIADPASTEESGAHPSTKAKKFAQTSVTISVTPLQDRLEITVTDEGYVPPPGLPKPRVSPHSDAHELRESGLGLYLMQSLMDEVEHVTGGQSQTVVRLVKYLPEHKLQTEIAERGL